jgi:hypothetical protein
MIHEKEPFRRASFAPARPVQKTRLAANIEKAMALAFGLFVGVCLSFSAFMILLI